MMKIISRLRLIIPPPKQKKGEGYVRATCQQMNHHLAVIIDSTLKQTLKQLLLESR